MNWIIPTEPTGAIKGISWVDYQPRIWVTAYHTSGKEILSTRTPFHGSAGEILFTFDELHIIRPVTYEELNQARQNGCSTTFFSIPDPF